MTKITIAENYFFCHFFVKTDNDYSEIYYMYSKFGFYSNFSVFIVNFVKIIDESHSKINYTYSKFCFYSKFVPLF